MASLFVDTLLKALSLQFVFLLAWGAPGVNPDPGLPDQTIAAHDVVLPVGGIIFGEENGRWWC
jgi:hypothetical protein